MKRKSIITTIAACLCLCLSAGIFAACTDDNGGDGGEDKGTLYSIQAPAASDVFTVTGLPENAYEGDTVTFQVTLSDPENSAVISVKPDTTSSPPMQTAIIPLPCPQNRLRSASTPGRSAKS